MRETPRCTTCDALFDSLVQLEYHKEEWEHFDGDDDDRHDDEAYLGAAQDYFFEEEEAREFAGALEGGGGEAEGIADWDLVQSNPQQAIANI